jgi:hypothetical protein
MSRETLKRDYQQHRLATEPDTFVLYRIIGNDLPPRHTGGQSRSNLAFILEHEPNLPDCEKRFVINRIVDPKEEQTIIAMLERAQLKYIHIPFKQEEYLKIPWDTHESNAQSSLCDKRLNALTVIEKNQILMRRYRLKNNYVMHNNGARNAALCEGRTLAKWVLPLDGNCFFTAKSWNEVRSTVTKNPEIPYYLVPMARITDNSLLLQNSFTPLAQDEPQVLFRADTALEFNAEYPYGRRPKVELLWRLGVPGAWDKWHIEPWDLPCPPFAEQAGNFGTAGWVARLYSGKKHLEKGLGKSAMRNLARTSAVTEFLDNLDRQTLR